MATNRLTRDPQRAIVGGVCAGIANRLDADINLIRLVTIFVAVVTGGIGAIVYIALWLIVPLPDASPGLPSREAISGELRGATERAKEAGGIIARAAKQAADELSEAAAKRSGTGAAAGMTADAATEGVNETPSEATADMGMPSDASTAPQSEPEEPETPPVPPANPQPYAADETRRQQEQQPQ